MTALVADIGGTNTRIALADPGHAPREFQRFANDSFSDFAAVLRAYLARHAVPALSGCCLAIAGPVAQNAGRLTNRDWSFTRPEIAALLPIEDVRQVHLINDLAALGYALHGLHPAQLHEIKSVGSGQAPNDQALVLGLGTGVNGCLISNRGPNPAVLVAELGHASLPESVARALRSEIGAAAAEFRSIETLFSGRGLPHLHRLLSGENHRSGAAILASYAGDPTGPAGRSVELMARLLGIFAQELVFQYLPCGGIHIAGGVGRGFLESAARDAFLAAYNRSGHFSDQIDQVPIRLITDDVAALTGAARFLTVAPAG